MKTDETLKTYTFATDSTSGTIQANTLGEAYAELRRKITDEMVENGATLWVEGEEGRVTMGHDED